MKKYIFIVVTAIIFSSVVFVYLKSSNEVLSNTDIELHQTSPYEELDKTPEYSKTNIDDDRDIERTMQPVDKNRSTKRDNPFSKLKRKGFEEDWCSTLELSPEDHEYSMQLDSDWRIAAGSYNFSYQPDRNSRFISANEALVEPYRDMVKSLLLKRVEQGEELAEFALLQRSDIHLPKKKRKIAEKLSFKKVKHTGNAKG